MGINDEDFEFYVSFENASQTPPDIPHTLTIAIITILSLKKNINKQINVSRSCNRIIHLEDFVIAM